MKDGKRLDVHRGPGKKGMKSLVVHLSPEEYEALKQWAEDECRTAASQARWAIRDGIRSRKGNGR